VKKSLIYRFLTGFVVGAIMVHAITLLANYLDSGSLLLCRPSLIKAMGFSSALALQTVLGAALGILAFGGMCFFDIEEWSLLRASVAHCALILVAYLIAGSMLHWFSRHIIPILIMSLITIVAYALIWLIMYALWKREIREMNRLAEEYKKDLSPGEDQR
jgi:MFS family permease